MRRGLLLAVLLTAFAACLASSVIHKEVHPDGSKDFTIVKYIKKNQCTCSCKCIPDDVDVNEPKVKPSEVILTQNQHSAEEVRAASKESEISDISAESSNNESTVATSSHESIQYESEESTYSRSTDRYESSSIVSNQEQEHNVTDAIEAATSTILGVSLSNGSIESDASTTAQYSTATSDAQQYESSTPTAEVTIPTPEATTTRNDEAAPLSTDIPKDTSSTADITSTNETHESVINESQTSTSLLSNNFENSTESTVTWNASFTFSELAESVVNATAESTDETLTTPKAEESSSSDVDRLTTISSITTTDNNDTALVSATTNILESSSVSQENVYYTTQSSTSDASTEISSAIEITTAMFTENNGISETNFATASPEVSLNVTNIPSDWTNTTTPGEIIEEAIIEDLSIVGANATNEIVEVAKTIQEHPEIPMNLTIMTTNHFPLESSPTTDKTTTLNEESTTVKEFQESTTTESDDDGLSEEEETDDESTEETTEPDVTSTAASESYSTEKKALWELESSSAVPSFKKDKEAGTSLESEKTSETAEGNSTGSENITTGKELQDNETTTEKTTVDGNDPEGQGVTTEGVTVKASTEISRKIIYDKYGRVVFRVRTPQKEASIDEGNVKDTLREDNKTGTDRTTASDEKQLNIEDGDSEIIKQRESEAHDNKSNGDRKNTPTTQTKQNEETSSIEATSGKNIEGTTKRIKEESLSDELPTEISERTTKRTKDPIEDVTEASLSSGEEAFGAEAIESEIKGGNMQREKTKTDVGGGRSFMIETKSDATVPLKTIENDGNERIRQGWREALERLRQKLRAHREQSKEKKIVVNVEENHTGDDDKSSNEAAKGSREGNDEGDDDEQEEKHLYLVQVVRDGKTTTNLSPPHKASLQRRRESTEEGSTVSTSYTSTLEQKARSGLTSLSESALSSLPAIDNSKSSSLQFKERDRNENSANESRKGTKNVSHRNEEETTSQLMHNSPDVDEAVSDLKKLSDDVTELKAATSSTGEHLSKEGKILNETKRAKDEDTESTTLEENRPSLSVKTNEGKGSSSKETAEGSDGKGHHENARKGEKNKANSNEENEKLSAQEAKRGGNKNSADEKKFEKDDTRLDKDEQKSIPEFEFSIDGPSEDDLKEGMTITIDRRPDEIVNSNSGKTRQSSMFSRWNTPTTNEGAPVNAKLLRRKIEEERNIAILKEEEMERFKKEEAIRMKEQAERARFLAQEESLLEMELNASNEEKEKRIREERERLEQARLLREEQMRIDRLHELNKGDAQKKELERREQITKQLEQLAETERKQHELIAQQDMALRMKEKAVKLAVLKATQNTSNALLKGDAAGLFIGVPTRMNTPTPQPTDTPSRGGGMQLSRAQCEAIRKFARVFQMADPAKWVHENCPFAKQYFPRASCSQIQQLFESCMQRT